MALMTETKTVVAVFQDMDSAQRAVRDLESAGFNRDSISVVANRNTNERWASTTTDIAATDDMATPARTNRTTADAAGMGDVATDAGIGAAIGGIGGLLLSFAGLAVPGIGPILAAGPIVAALSGAGVGAVAGGIIGALTESGIPEEEAHRYAEGVRRGNVLVTVRTDDAGANRAQSILDNSGAVNVEDHEAGWRQRGWTGYNPGAEPMSVDELRREREWNARTGDIGTELPRAEAQNAAIDRERTRDAVTNAGSLGSTSTVGMTPSGYTNRPNDYSEAVENNVHNPSPASIRAEQGFQRAMDSASQSARRTASRVYSVPRR